MSEDKTTHLLFRALPDYRMQCTIRALNETSFNTKFVNPVHLGAFVVNRHTRAVVPATFYHSLPKFDYDQWRQQPQEGNFVAADDSGLPREMVEGQEYFVSLDEKHKLRKMNLYSLPPFTSLPNHVRATERSLVLTEGEICWDAESGVVWSSEGGTQYDFLFFLDLIDCWQPAGSLIKVIASPAEQCDASSCDHDSFRLAWLLWECFDFVDDDEYLEPLTQLLRLLCSSNYSPLSQLLPSISHSCVMMLHGLKDLLESSEDSELLSRLLPLLDSPLIHSSINDPTP